MRPRLPLHLPFAGRSATGSLAIAVKLFSDVIRHSAVAFSAASTRFSADLNRLKEARDFGERAAEEFGLPPEARYQVKLALSEAVTNAIQHGSSSPDSTIRIYMSRGGAARSSSR